MRTPRTGTAPRTGERSRRRGSRPVRRTARLAGLAVVTAGLTGSGLFAVGGAVRTSDPGAAVVAAAYRELGDTYQWGGTGPSRWDCSGLTSDLWRRAGVTIPRTARDQAAWATPVSTRSARPGDLVFFGSPVTHVAIYLGRGEIIDASSSRGQVVHRKIWSGEVLRFGRVSAGRHAVRPAPRVVAPRATRTRAVSGLRPVPPVGMRQLHAS